MKSAIAVGLPTDLCRTIGHATGEEPQVLFTESDFLARLAELPDAVDLAVIGPAIAAPVRVAQRVRAMDRDVPLLIVTEPGALAAQRRLLRYAASVGEDVHLASDDDLTGVAALARDATRRSRERRRYRSGRELLRSVAPRRAWAQGSPDPAVTVSVERPRQRSARAGTERADERSRIVGEASARLDEAFDVAETVRAIGDALVPALADVCLIDIVEDSGDVRRLAPVHASHLDADVVSRLARYAPQRDGSQPASEVLRTYGAVLLADLDDARLRTVLGDDEHVEIEQRLGARSAMALPLLARGRLLGTLTLIAARGRDAYADADLELATEIALRCALALEGALMYESARAAADAERRARQKAEEAVALRDLFLSIASHELRTPLTALLGRVHLALRQLDRGVDRDGVRTTLLRAVTQGGRLARLLGQLLDVSRIDSGKLELQPVLVDLVPMLRDAVEIARDSSPDHRWEVTSPPQLRASVDAPRLEQVVLNLLDNAARYAPVGSTVVARLTREGDDIVLEVEDEGPGIPAVERERIFQRFQQMGGHSAGIGLGLYVAREIVERHGGRIDVHGRERGRGSRFVVRVPARDEGPDASAVAGA